MFMAIQFFGIKYYFGADEILPRHRINGTRHKAQGTRLKVKNDIIIGRAS
jgi:hypothetical protein